MIELVIGAGLATAGALAYGLWRRRFRQTPSHRGAARDQRALDPADGSRDLGGDPRVGDVVLIGADELWLTSKVTVREAGRRIELWRASEGSGTCCLARIDVDARWAILRDTAEVPPGSVPDSWTIAGCRFGLAWRGRGSVGVEGRAVDDSRSRSAFGSEVDFVYMLALGGRCLLVFDPVDTDDAGGGDRDATPTRLALIGEMRPRTFFDLLPGSAATANRSQD